MKDKSESYKHDAAKKVLASWLDYDVRIEMPFTIDDRIVFVPDLTCMVGDAVICLYEVVHSHFIDGIKLGRIQSWCYRNFTELSVYEIDAEYILKQTEKPDIIEKINVYEITFEPAEIDESIIGKIFG